MTTQTIAPQTNTYHKPSLPLTIANLVSVRRDGDTYYARYEGYVEVQKTIALSMWTTSNMTGKKNISQAKKKLDTRTAREFVEREEEISQEECRALVEASRMTGMAYEPTNKVYDKNDKLIGWTIFFKEVK